mmetsp:Transcript_9330/g.20624  ORF Transcript_9330/g.20624 Transcript_9330/m.20624 type:complete len:263 (-) Transcript_9330:328-1116(-)
MESQPTLLYALKMISSRLKQLSLIIGLTHTMKITTFSFPLCHNRWMQHKILNNKIGLNTRHVSSAPAFSRLAALSADRPDQIVNMDMERIPYSPPSPPQITLMHEGSSITFPIQAHETILSAMERENAGARLSLSHSQSDCRRGSCMTCAGRILCQVKNGAVLDVGRRGAIKADADFLGGGLEDGEEYVLTCSAYVTANVTVEVGLCEELWEKRFLQRLASDDTRRAGREASAHQMREAAEKNVKKFKENMEQLIVSDSSSG